MAFTVCFRALAKSLEEQFFSSLEDNTPPVREAAAIALGCTVRAYGMHNCALISTACIAALFDHQYYVHLSHLIMLNTCSLPLTSSYHVPPESNPEISMGRQVKIHVCVSS